MPHGQPFEEATYISHPISDMARIRGAHTDPSLSREPRPRASSPQDSSQAPEALTVPSFEDGVPSNPIAHSQLDSQALADSQRPSDISPEAIIKRPMPKLQDSFGLLQRYHLECLLTPREFFYPRVAIDFYQSMTTQGSRSPTIIHFSIDGRQGILEAKHIAEALHIPYKPVDPTHFQEWAPIFQQEIVCILSRGTSGDSFLLCKELPFGMLLVDVLMRSNIFPLQHLVQR
ncbi:hypothetical protein CK203_115640 [Vitis vinifera]|uniref:Uncharacterized protein n=1 Tax=Vitis vinifera TaxID=29760 RepID=A0A438CED3_VITVI|nr:hypothetical protein CK203_115640 [Vitis vinifera]